MVPARLIRTTVTVLALALAATACAKSPVEEIAAAEAAIRDARAAEAPVYAPEAFAEAERAMADTYRLTDAKDYDGARDKAIETRALAERARDLALAAKQKTERAGRDKDGDGGRLRVRTASETAAEISSSTIGAGALDEGARIDAMGPVLFAFDDYSLAESELPKVRDAADWLIANVTARVRLEGHTDERGSADYNMTLGGRRADSVRQLLESYGVEAARIETRSYGEEMPADPGHDDAAWAANRRVEFVVIP